METYDSKYFSISERQCIRTIVAIGMKKSSLFFNLPREIKMEIISLIFVLTGPIDYTPSSKNQLYKYQSEDDEI
jgi:hypothetical protein